MPQVTGCGEGAASRWRQKKQLFSPSVICDSSLSADQASLRRHFIMHHADSLRQGNHCIALLKLITGGIHRWNLARRATPRRTGSVMCFLMGTRAHLESG